MIWSVNNYNGATAYRDYQAGILSLVSGAQLATLAVNGDTITFSFNFIEQVAAGVSFSDFVTDNGETYTREWRTSTDSSTWTAWATLNNAAVAAFTATANNKLYIQVRYTRTSAGAPPITVYGFLFRLTYTATATSGRGTIEDTNCFSDIPALFAGMAQATSLQTSGAPAFATVLLPPSLSSKENKPTMYIHGLMLDPQISSGCGYWTQRGRIYIGVKKLARENQAQADRQFSEIFAAFSAMRWYQSTYNLTYKGDVYVSATASTFGFLEMSSQNSTEYSDNVTNDYYREMVVSFKIQFTQNPYTD